MTMESFWEAVSDGTISFFVSTIFGEMYFQNFSQKLFHSFNLSLSTTLRENRREIDPATLEFI
jgi:hypothetical protein